MRYNLDDYQIKIYVKETEVTEKRPDRRYKRLLITTGVIIVFGFLAYIPMERTSRTDYCMTCHELKPHKAELEKSSHAVDKDKNPIECRQCHIPNGIGLKYLTVKIMGLKDLWAHQFGDAENLDRRMLQTIAKRYVQDSNCRACHQDLFKTTKDEKISEIGRLSHEAYLGKNGNTKNGCAGCHPNMAHLPDFDRRYEFNAKFAENIPPVKERKQ